MQMLRAATVRGCGDAHGHILPMESQEPHVAIVASIRPDEEERIEKVLDKTLAHGAPHNGALAVRALIYSFGEQESHGWFEASVLCSTEFQALQRLQERKFPVGYWGSSR